MALKLWNLTSPWKVDTCKTCLGIDIRHREGFKMFEHHIKVYKCINKRIYNNENPKIASFISLHGFKSMIFEFSLKSWYRKLVSELNLDTGKALKCWYEGV